MSVNLSIRPYQLTIAGLDCTANLAYFRGSDSKLDESGLVTFRGTLELGVRPGFESLDDRVNDRWARGNVLELLVADSTGSLVPPPRGGTLRILDALYDVKKRRLQLQVGDILELLRYREPTTNAWKVCLGTLTSRMAIINRLLATAKAPQITDLIPGSLNSSTPRTIEGSYIDQAGAIAAAAGWFLCVDSSEGIRAYPIETGQSDSLILIDTPQIVDTERVTGELPASYLVVNGRAIAVKQSEDSSESVTEEPGTAGMAGNTSSPDEPIIVRRTQKSDSFDRGSKTRNITSQIKQPVGLLLPDDSDYAGNTALIDSEVRTETYSYEQNAPVMGSSSGTTCEQGNQGRLKTYQLLLRQIVGVALREIASSYPSGSGLNKTDLMIAEQTIVTYDYSPRLVSQVSLGPGTPDEWVEKRGDGPLIVTRTLRPIGSILTEEFSYNPGSMGLQPERLIESYRKIQYWEETSLGEWREVIQEYKTLAEQSPTTADNLRSVSTDLNQLIARLISLVPVDPTENRSNAGQAQPPAAETYQPAYNQSEKVVKGVAKLPANAASNYRQAQREMTFDYLTGINRAAGQAEATALAKLWGVLLWGRYKCTSYTTDLADSWWNYRPGVRVDAREPGTRFAYLGDGFAIAMAQNRCVVSFDGLYLGQVATMPSPDPEVTDPIELPGEILTPYVRAEIFQGQSGGMARLQRSTGSTAPIQKGLQGQGGGQGKLSRYQAWKDIDFEAWKSMSAENWRRIV